MKDKGKYQKKKENSEYSLRGKLGLYLSKIAESILDAGTKVSELERKTGFYYR